MNVKLCCKVSGVLLGDKGYDYRSFFLTPIADPQIPPQQRYNHASKTIFQIELIFVPLKSHFQCLHQLRVSLDRVYDIIPACIVLHNIAGLRKEKGLKGGATSSLLKSSDTVSSSAEVRSAVAVLPSPCHTRTCPERP